MGVKQYPAVSSSAPACWPLLLGLVLLLAGACRAPSAPAGRALPPPPLRKFPFPYRAALTITSDIDSCTREEFLEIHQFLNTKEDTSQNVRTGRDSRMGGGVGLELGDSFFMLTDCDPGRGSLTYFANDSSTTPSLDAELIKTYAHAGYIDALHSFGNMDQPASFTRGLAVAALAEMKRAGLAPTLFVDHGTARNLNNIGPPWAGDLPGAPAHHTDLSIWPRGPVLFVNNGATTTAIGYDPLRPAVLRDGTPAYLFTRYNGPEGWNVECLEQQLSRAHLGALVAGEGYWVVPNHLGMLRGGGSRTPVFGESTRAALRELERRYRGGEILVATASRLLWYAYVHRNLDYRCLEGPGATQVVDIRGVNDPVYGFFVPTVGQLQGLTFITDRPEKIRVRLAGADVTAQVRANPPDHRGERSVSFPLRPLPPLPEWTCDGATSQTEQYAVTDYHYTLAVESREARDFSPTLTYVGLHPFSVREVQAGAGELIFVPEDGRVRLPRLRPGERLDGLRILNGPWNPGVPRLTGSANPAVEITSATCERGTGVVRIALCGTGLTTLTFRHLDRPLAGARCRIGAAGDLAAAVEARGERRLESAGLALRPAAGWVEVALEAWPPRGGRAATWTEKSSQAGPIAHTAGGLAPGAAFRVRVDGAAVSAARADSGGVAVFETRGDGAAHTVELEAGPS